MRIFGIDPGAEGAMSVFVDGRLVEVLDLPVIEGQLDVGEFVEMLQWTLPDLICLEDAHAMPTNGSVANFKTGLNHGLTRGAIQSLKLPLQRVAPVTWKRNMGLIGTKKDRSLLLARELFPHLRESFKLAKHHNRADAALIGRWAGFQQIQKENAQ